VLALLFFLFIHCLFVRLFVCSCVYLFIVYGLVHMSDTVEILDELEIVAGDIVYVTHTYDDGWCKAYSVRGEGIVPANYLIPLPTDAHQLPPIPSSRLGSTPAPQSTVNTNVAISTNDSGANVSGDLTEGASRGPRQSVSHPGEGLPRLVSFRNPQPQPLSVEVKDNLQAAMAKNDSEMVAEVCSFLLSFPCFFSLFLFLVSFPCFVFHT
jgi:hypothetical protein